MTIRPSTNHGQPAWIVNYSILGKQKRKYFPRNPSLRKQCPGYLEAEKFGEGLSKKVFSEGPTIASMGAAERVEMLGWWHKIKQTGVHPQRALDAALAMRTDSPMLSVVCGECVKSKESTGKRKKYVSCLKSSLTIFAKAHPNMTIAEVAPSTIEEWLSLNWKNAKTRKSKFSDIRTLMAFAKRRGYVKENPCERIEPITVVPKMPGILRPKAAAKLMRGAWNRDRELCPHLALGLFCGLRPAEIEKITAAQIHLDRMIVEVTIEMSKTTQRRIVKIPENAIPWLECKTTYPLVNPAKRFKKLRKALGLWSSWPHDALRHSSASYHYALTEDAAAVAKMHGHSVNVLLTNYNATKTPGGELVTREMARDFFNIRPMPIVRLLESVA